MHFLHVPAAACLAALTFTPPCAGAAPVTGWQIGQNNINGDLSLTDAGTASPVWGDNFTENADATSIYAPIPETALAAVGDKVTLTGSATVIGGTPAGEQFRWGFFHTNGSQDTLGWLGYWAGNGQTTTGSTLRERNEGNSTFYFASGETLLLSRSVAPAASFTDATYTFSLEIERMADGLHFHSLLVRTSDDVIFCEHAYLHAAPVALAFNRVALLSGGTLNADQILLKDVDATYTPAAAPDLRVLEAGLNAAGTAFTLSWTSAPGATYSLYRSEDLAGWEKSEGGILSGGDSTGLTVPLPSPRPDRLFWQIREEP